MGSPRIEVADAAPAIDTRLRVRVRGIGPGGEVTLRARTRDGQGRLWEAHASFTADPAGEVDVTRQPPSAGSYRGADPMGLVWSMTRVRRARRTPRERRILPPAMLSLSADVGGEQVAEATVERVACDPEVVRARVHWHGLVGTMFTPRWGGRLPGVILLGGAEGGMHELDAALLARHGFCVLALAYFGSRGRPPDLVRIPLEYFGTAIEFLQARRRVRPDRLGVVGGSRGGEAALLIGATLPGIRAVVSLVGSAVLTEGIGPGGHVLEKIGQPLPSWTYRGADLPYLRCRVTPEVTTRAGSGEPFELAEAFEPALPDAAAIAEATIPVERIPGGVLFISAGADRMWPCQALSEVGAQRLAAARRPHQHIVYPEAGHLIAAPPYGPTTELVTPGPGVKFQTGGTPAANAAARADAWRHTIGFLRDQLNQG